METIETQCCLCDVDIVATADDPRPMCETCQGTYAEAQIVIAIAAGEITVPGEEDDEEEEDA